MKQDRKSVVKNGVSGKLIELFMRELGNYLVLEKRGNDPFILSRRLTRWGINVGKWRSCYDVNNKFLNNVKAQWKGDERKAMREVTDRMGRALGTVSTSMIVSTISSRSSNSVLSGSTNFWGKDSHWRVSSNWICTKQMTPLHWEIQTW